MTSLAGLFPGNPVPGGLLERGGAALTEPLRHSDRFSRPVVMVRGTTVPSLQDCACATNITHWTARCLRGGDLRRMND
jgi:hypothetical protein